MTNIQVPHNDLKELVSKKLLKAKVRVKEAELIAEILVHADLRGVSSHGVLRTEHYLKRLHEGGINNESYIDIEEKGFSASLVDGDHGFGHVITKRAMEEAIKLSKKNGLGLVSVVNSSHCGALSYYAEQAAKEETISMIMTHTDSAVVPFGGSAPYFGTNPIAYGFPAKKHQPIILDMATSHVAFGKVLQARENGQAIPDNWGIDDSGKSVTDPNLVKHLLPMSGPKGFGLALVVDVMTGVLTGSNFGPSITPMYGDYDRHRKLSHTILTIDPGLFIEKNQFLKSVDQMIDELHELKPSTDFSSVMVPGEPEKKREAERLTNGIPIPEHIYTYLCT